MSSGLPPDPPVVVAPVDAPEAVTTTVELPAAGSGFAHWVLVRHRASWIQLLQYSVVGASGAAVNLVINHYVLQGIGRSHIWIASTVAFLIANVWNYLLNRAWTFGSHGHSATPTQYSRFLTVGLASLVVQLVVLQICHRGLHVDSGSSDDISQLIGIAFATPVGFVGNKLWTFRVRHV